MSWMERKVWSKFPSCHASHSLCALQYQKIIRLPAGSLKNSSLFIPWFYCIGAHLRRLGCWLSSSSLFKPRLYCIGAHLRRLGYCRNLILNMLHLSERTKNSFQCKQISSPEMLSSNRLWNRSTVLITLLPSLPLLPLSCEFLSFYNSPFLSLVPKCKKGNRNVLTC